jgi:hypothetical protein
VNNNIFVPEKINVGFRNRNDTYTKKLAYVIYYDQKGVLRKENSWNSWRDKTIEPKEFQNTPTSGFVLNKKAGGYSTGWNHRQTYCRVYDPRDFEFEITIENLLYILENTSSIIGKGLEGEFVYGWDGTELLLIPTSSPDYREISNFNNKLRNKVNFQGKDLILGATYKFKNNVNRVYMGRFQKFNNKHKEIKEYFFHEKSPHYKNNDLFISFKSLSGQIIDIVDDNCIADYAMLMDKMSKLISERDHKRDAYIPYTFEQFETYLRKCTYQNHFYTENGVKYFVRRYYQYYYYNPKNETFRYDIYGCDNKNRASEKLDSDVSVDSIYKKYKPAYLVTYKYNGELIKEWKNIYE